MFGAKRQDRGGFLVGGAASVAAFNLIPGRARAAQFEYRSAHTQPPDTPPHTRQLQLWDAVKRETDGRLVVRVFPSSQLGSQTSLLSEVRLGAIQIITLINSAYSDFIPVAGIDSVGFAFKDSQSPWNVMTGPLGDYVRKEFEAKDLHIPRGGIFDTGLRQITSSTKPIRNAADLSGFKLRVPPGRITVDLFKTLGASPVGMNQGEVYTSLQTHVLDGQETPYLSILANKLFEVQKYLSITNHMWSGDWLVMNSASWKALPPDIQAIVERNVAKYLLLARDDAWRANDVAADKLRQAGIAFNTADTQSMRARLSPYYARWKSEFGKTTWDLLEASVGRLG